MPPLENAYLEGMPVQARIKRNPTPKTCFSVCLTGETLVGLVVREELRRLLTWQERHRRLLARLIIALSLSVVVDLLGALVIWHWENGLKGSDVHGFGDAIFFSTVQILTVSSSMKNPLTAVGKTVDVVLEI